MNQPPKKLILCGNVETSLPTGNDNVIKLSYFDISNIKANVIIDINKFVSNPETLPTRIVDLLEIAAYVFTADRAVFRGGKESLNNNSWARTFEFHIPVREYNFWTTDVVASSLSDALSFMTGDRKYEFVFYKYISDHGNARYHQLSMFNDEYVNLDEADKTDVMLFSGGLDSLAGATECLNKCSGKRICLVSHQANSSTIHTQNILVEYLQNKYNNRIKHYKFRCHFANHTASKDETQRTRMFLYSSIAFAICSCYEKHSFYVYENGITSMNLPKQADVMNARASRTTHPKTIGLLQIFYRLFDDAFTIYTPYFFKIKKDILEIISQSNELNLISSTVSCSSTRNKPGNATHCGYCSQCIDRIFAAYAAKLEDYDDVGIYSDNFIMKIPDHEAKQRLYYTLRMAAMEGIKSKDDFVEKYLNELIDIIDFIPGDNPDDKLDDIYKMFCYYGDSVLSAAKRMQAKYEDLAKSIPSDSILAMIANREHLISPTLQRVREIDSILNKAIPIMFQREKPKSENDFNDKVQAILRGGQNKFEREYPSIRFGLANFVPDHSQDYLLIESKYIRENTTPSVATAGIAQDITKAPNNSGILFVVYDPYRMITKDEVFIEPFEKKREACYVRIYR